jgi:transposase
MGAHRIVPEVMALIGDAEAAIPDVLREMFHQVCLEIRQLESQMKSVERELKAIAAQTPAVERLQSIPGIGLMTATAMVGFVGNIQRFRSSRHFASYLGLTPREHSSGNYRRLGRINKQGDTYLRMLLVHGGRSVLWSAHRKSIRPSPLQQWGLKLHETRGHNKATVALANKLARRVWAVWKRDSEYQVDYQAA